MPSPFDNPNITIQSLCRQKKINLNFPHTLMQNIYFKNSIKRPPRALLSPGCIRENSSFTAPCQLNEYFRAVSAHLLRQSSPQNCESQIDAIRTLVAQTEPIQGASNKTGGNSAYTPEEGSTVLQEEHSPWRTLTPWFITRKHMSMSLPTQTIQGFYDIFLFKFFQLTCELLLPQSVPTERRFSLFRL